jgi:predicted acetyltransferase
MSELTLVKPSTEYADEIRTYRQEFLDAGETNYGGAIYEDVDAWIEQCRLMEDSATVPVPGWVEADYYMMVREGDIRVLGMINFRHFLNDHLAEIGGHIGYHVRPSERDRGYAKAMLALCLQKCTEFGLDRVLITCTNDNVASRQVILANGGVFDRTTKDGDLTLERYWIDLLAP